MERKVSYDIIKVFAILSAMILHYEIAEIRHLFSFCVPLLVFLSGVLYKSSGAKTTWQYLWKRIKRIVIPTYLFVFFVLFCRVIVCILFDASYYTVNEILWSVLLSDEGIGYIWISRIFIVLSILSSFLEQSIKKIKSNILFFLLCIVAIAMSEFLTICLMDYSTQIWFEYSVYLIPYIVIYSIGIRAGSSKKFNMCVFLLSAISFAISTIINGFAPGAYKYPPQLQYITYGCLISSSVFLITEPLNKIKFQNGIKSFIRILSIDSFNIYLIHAFMVILYGWSKRHLPFHFPTWLLMIITIGIPIMVCFLYRNKKEGKAKSAKKIS